MDIKAFTSTKKVQALVVSKEDLLPGADYNFYKISYKTETDAGIQESTYLSKEPIPIGASVSVRYVIDRPNMVNQTNLGLAPGLLLFSFLVNLYCYKTEVKKRKSEASASAK